MIIIRMNGFDDMGLKIRSFYKGENGSDLEVIMRFKVCGSENNYF